jgi:hypothetical protein
MQIMRHDGNLAYRTSRSFTSLAQPRKIMIEIQGRAAIYVQRAMHMD